MITPFLGSFLFNPVAGATGATGPSGPTGATGAGGSNLLTTATGISTSNTGSHVLYTVATGASGPAIVQGAVVRVTSGSPTAGPWLSMGTSPGSTILANVVSAVGLTGAAGTATIGSTFFMNINGLSSCVPAGGSVYVNVPTAATGASQTVAIDLLGYIV